jgi:hypothetical protein
MELILPAACRGEGPRITRGVKVMRMRWWRLPAVPAAAALIVVGCGVGADRDPCATGGQRLGERAGPRQVAGYAGKRAGGMDGQRAAVAGHPGPGLDPLGADGNQRRPRLGHGQGLHRSASYCTIAMPGSYLPARISVHQGHLVPSRLRSAMLPTRGIWQQSAAVASGHEWDDNQQVNGQIAPS